MLYLFQPCLFFLSFFPLWISIAILDIRSVCGSEANIWTEKISLLLMGLCALISILVVATQMRKAKKGPATHPVIKRATEQKAVTAEYLLSYILPLFTFDFTKWIQVVLFLIFFATLAFLCLRHHHIYANIALELCHYTCYDCILENLDGSEFEAVVLSTTNLTGMLNHPINYIDLDGGYGLGIKSNA